MSDKFQNKYRIPSNRLKGYDYGAHGLYFVTICTKDRIDYFGEIVETNYNPSNNTYDLEPRSNVALNNEPHYYVTLRETRIAQIALGFWREIPKHYPFVEIDEFVIMPNHIHGILFFNRLNKLGWNENKFGSQSGNLGAVIRGFKSSVKRFANQNQIDFEWQPRYHDRIIRDEKELRAVREYIINNPQKWVDDELNNCRDGLQSV